MIWDRLDSEHKRVLLLCLGLFLLFGLFGFLSPGTHNDDDITRFLNTRAALQDPSQILSRWNRPGFVLLYLLPARLGYWAVELLTALLSALTCYFAYRTAKVLRLDNAPMVVIFTAFQPFFFQLSFSALTEPLAAFLLSVSLYLLCARRYLASALVAAAIPLARLELAIILILWVVRYIRVRSWKSILVLPLGVIVWNFAGFFATGDALYLLHQVFTGAERTYDSVGLLHYPRGYIYVVGPVIFALSILGLVNSLWRRQLTFVSSGFLIMIAAYTYLSIGSSAGQAAGFLRHVVAIAPFTALLSLKGFNAWCVKKPPFDTLVVLLGSTVVCWFFFSVKAHQSFRPGLEPEYLKVASLGIMTLVVLVLRFVPSVFPWRHAKKVLPLLAVVLCIVYNFTIEQIIRLSPERQTVKDIANWYMESGLQDRITLCNHTWFHFFNKSDRLRRDRYPLLTKENLVKAPPGAIAVWEGHYSYRLIGDVLLEDITRFRTYHVLKRFISESGFFAIVLEKTSEEESRGNMSEGVYRHPGFGVRWDVRDLQHWAFAPKTDELNLLQGWHSSGVTLHLSMSRYFRHAPQSFLNATETQLAKRQGVEVTGAETQGSWRWIWGRQGGRELVLGVMLSPERCGALYLGFTFPPEKRSWLRRELPHIVEGLMFEPVRILAAR